MTVISQEFSRILSPLLHYLKKMELELTCPTCFNLLRKPTLLPCNHIFCSQCIRTEVNCQSNCLACKSSFSSGDLRHAFHLQALIEIFKGMDAAFSAISQKLDSHVDTSAIISIGTKTPSKGIHVSDHATIEATKLFPRETSLFYSSQSEVCSQDSQVHISGIKGPSIKCCASGCKNMEEKEQPCNADIPSLTVPSKGNPVSNCIIGVDEELQGSQFGEKVPKKGTSGSHNNTEETLQENLAFKRPDKKITENVYTRRLRDEVKCRKPATFGSKNQTESEGKKTSINQGDWEIPPHSYPRVTEIDCNHQENNASSSSLSLDNSQNKDTEAKAKGRNKLLPCTDPLTCVRQHSEKSNHNISCGQYSQPDAVNVQKLKRQKSNDSHVAIPGNQLMQTSGKLPKLEPAEDCIHDFQTAAFGNCKEWLLCGSDLSPTQEDFVRKFASLTSASVSRMWKKHVTHVIIPTDKHGACRSTNKVLLAILSGKWVLKFNWIEAYFRLKKPVPEEPYEIGKIRIGVYDCFNGPKKGRLRVRDKAPRIFSGLNFFFCDQFNSIDRGYEDLIVAAGGTVLKKDDLVSLESNRAVFSSQSSYIVYNEDPPACNSLRLDEIGRKRCDEVAALEKNTGFKVIGHLWLLHTIASYNSADELAKGAIN